MTEGASYHRILRSSSIIGAAALLNILLGVLRTKVAALLLGPAGIGLIGLYSTFMTTASTIIGVGIGNAGTRQIAEAASREDVLAVSAARRALFWGSLWLSLLGAVLVWLLREPLASVVLTDAAQADSVGWLALGVALTVAGASQGALLNGLRRIGDMARISVLSAMTSTVLGLTALWYWGEGGLLAFVLAGPLASFLLAHLYVARLPRTQSLSTPLSGQWLNLARLGAAFMLAGLVGTLAQLMVRILVYRELGTLALGHFQAAWMISMTYIGFVLQAMGSDYYPRLTGVIHDHTTVNRMVNEQAEVALLLSGPVLLAMLGFAPWVIELLYTQQFQPAVEVLRWQVLGDVLKVASWPLGFIILAAGDGRTYLVSESIGFVALVVLTWLGLPWLGLEATGIAFVAMYVVYLLMVYWLASQRTGFRWAPSVRWLLLLLLTTALTALIAARWHPLAGVILSTFFSVVLVAHAISRLAQMTNLGGPLGRAGAHFRKLFMKFGIWHE